MAGRPAGPGPRGPAERTTKVEQVWEMFREVYRTTWSHQPVRAVLSSERVGNLALLYEYWIIMTMSDSS